MIRTSEVEKEEDVCAEKEEQENTLLEKGREDQ